jgi:hypothetical protein
VQKRRPVGREQLARPTEDPRPRAVGPPHPVLHLDDRAVHRCVQDHRLDTFAVLGVDQIGPAPLGIAPDEVLDRIPDDRQQLSTDELVLERRDESRPVDHARHRAEERFQLG